MTAVYDLKPIGEICEFQRGLTYAKSDEVDASNTVVLRANNVDLASNQLDLSDLRFISDDVHVPVEKRLRRGSLLICTASGSKSHLGKVAHIDEDYGFAFGGFMGQITPKEGVDGRFLYYALTTPAYRDFILKLSDGANINNLKFSDLQKFEVAVPSISEQRRIVAILDEALEGIATAKAHAEQNLRNASEVFQAAIANAMTMGCGGETKSVADWVASGVLAKPQDGNHGEIHPTKADYVEEGVPFVMAADLIGGVVDQENCRFISQKQADGLRIGFAKSGDVLLSHKGTIGRVALLLTELDYVMLTPQVTYYRQIDATRLSSEFLYFALQAPGFQSAMAAIADAGSTRAYIGITKQLDLKLTLPPLVKQLDLAKVLRELEGRSAQLIDIYRRKLTALDELKQSLLHQAFTGQL